MSDQDDPSETLVDKLREIHEGKDKQLSDWGNTPADSDVKASERAVRQSGERGVSDGTVNLL